MISCLRSFLFLLTFFLAGMFAVYANADIVILDTRHVKNNKIFPPVTEEYHKRPKIIEEKSLWLEEDDEEVFETKTGKFFGGFVNQKVINNKLNIFSMPDDRASGL